MKKSIIVLAVLALVAAPMFADSEYSATGDFDFEFDINLDGDDDLVTSDALEADISLGATVGEYTTFSAAVSDTDLSECDNVMKLDRFTMTQDYSAIFGIDGVGIKATFGYQSLEANDLTDDYLDDSYSFDDHGDLAETKDYVGLKTALDFGAAKLNLGVFPGTYDEDNPAFMADLIASASIVEITAHFAMGPDEALEEDVMSTGVGIAAAVADGLTAVAAVEVIDLEETATMDVCVGANYASGPLDTTVSFLMKGLEDAPMLLGLYAGYEVIEDLTPYVGFGLDFAGDDMLADYFVGVTKDIDTVSYSVEYNIEEQIAFYISVDF